MAYAHVERPVDPGSARPELVDRIEGALRHDAAGIGEAQDAAREAIHADLDDLAVYAHLSAFSLSIRARRFETALVEYSAALRLTDGETVGLDEDVRSIARGAASAAVPILVGDPDLPRESIESFLDAVEVAHRRVGAPMGGVLEARARWAAIRGDAAAFERLLDEVESERGRGRGTGVPGELPLRTLVELRAWLDPVDAIRLLEARRAAEPADERESLELATLHAWLLALLGDAQGALEEGRLVVAASESDELADEPWTDLLLRAVEPDRELGREVLGFTVGDIDVDRPADFLRLAAVARFDLQDDPASPRGVAGRGRAFAHAAAFDARNGTDMWSGVLRDRFFADAVIGVGTAPSTAAPSAA